MVNSNRRVAEPTAAPGDCRIREPKYFKRFIGRLPESILGRNHSIGCEAVGSHDQMPVVCRAWLAQAATPPQLRKSALSQTKCFQPRYWELKLKRCCCTAVRR